jgi:hypothetical protein
LPHDFPNASIPSMAKVGLLALLSLSALLGCEGRLDENRFRRRAEKAYIEVHAGWTIIKRDIGETTFVRGDQIDTLDVKALFSEYQASKQSASDFFDAWMANQRKLAEERRRTLEEAKEEVIPIIKSGSWINVQDLGAIGPERMRDQIRPWRKKIADDVFVVLGVPEEKLGYRFASIEEVTDSKDGEMAWLDKAIANIVQKAGTSTGAESMTGNDGRLLAIDFANIDGVSALILDPRFRQSMLAKFNLVELGAAVPIRNVLIVFDPKDFITLKPIAARAHKLYDTQNHPGFRGLLRFDRDFITVLQPAKPKK